MIERTRSVRVWDLPTRMIHWLLAVFIAFSWWTHKTDHMAWHKLSGFAIAGLLVWRVHLGFFGAETSRFGNFLKSPRAALHYLRGKAARRAGHNPFGGWNVAAMLIVLLLQVALGLFASDEDGIQTGPLADIISPVLSRLAAYVHAWVFEALLVLIALHVVAVLLHLRRGDNVLGAMLAGSRTMPLSVPEPAKAPPGSHAIGLALAAATFALLWHLDAG